MTAAVAATVFWGRGAHAPGVSHRDVHRDARPCRHPADDDRVVIPPMLLTIAADLDRSFKRVAFVASAYSCSTVSNQGFADDLCRSSARLNEPEAH
jgi:hypothetical protein